MTENIIISYLDSKKGRGLVSTVKILPNDVVFSEDPILCCQFSWNKLYGYSACDFCLRPLESAEENSRRLTNKSTLVLPVLSSLNSEFSKRTLAVATCPECGLIFCSPECLSLAMRLYHSIMCMKSNLSSDLEPLNKLELVWRQTHFPPETNTVMLLLRIVAMNLISYFKKDTLAAERVSALSNFVCGCVSEIHSDVLPTPALVHKMLGEKFYNQLEMIHQAFIEAISFLLSQVVSDMQIDSAMCEIGLGSILTRDGFCTALSLLGRNGQGVATSPLSQWVKMVEEQSKLHIEANVSCATNASHIHSFIDKLYSDIDDHVGPFLDSEGVALYQYQSLINHSCEPNTQIQFNGDSSRLSVVAKSVIEPGDEITISYLDECMLVRSRHSRRRHLAENYLFICECIRCLCELSDGAQSETSEEEEDNSDNPAEHQAMEK